jgi:Fe-S cluster assembly protein SufD
MTEMLQASTDFDVAWAERALEQARAAGEPEWSLGLRRAAAEQARGLEFPSRTDELWRRTDFRSLQDALPGLDPFLGATAARDVSELPAPIASRLAEAGSSAILVQQNGVAIYERVPAELERQGVIVCSLDRAVREHGDKVRAFLGTRLEAGYDWYTAVGAMLRTGGAFVYVPDGVEAAVPVHLFQWLHGPGALAAPRTVVVLGKRAQATVVDEQLSATTDGVAFHMGGTEVFLGDDSKLVFGTLQDWGRNVYHYSNDRAVLGRHAELQWIQTMLGSRMAKANAYFDLAAPGGQAFVHGFMFGDTRQHFHLHTLQRHLADHCTSDLLIKSCLKDRARSVYQGLIQVAEGAQRTDAYQANRNLLLSDKARADSIPGLEILANDVRCTHGATIGQVDAEQMFYLMARGLPQHVAQRLIVEGFFAPVIDRIPLVDVQARLREAIEHKIGPEA